MSPFHQGGYQTLHPKQKGNAYTKAPCVSGVSTHVALYIHILRYVSARTKQQLNIVCPSVWLVYMFDYVRNAEDNPPMILDHGNTLKACVGALGLGQRVYLRKV